MIVKRYEAVFPIMVEKRISFLAESEAEALEIMEKYGIVPFHEEWVPLRNFLMEEREYVAEFNLNAEELIDSYISFNAVEE